MFRYFIKIIFALFLCLPTTLYASELLWPQKIEKVDVSAQPTGWLQSHEDMGGHVIERHVNKSDDYLHSRIKNGRINEASSFISLALAEQIIALGLWENIEELAQWMKDDRAADRMVIEINDPTIVGKGVRRGEQKILERYGARIVLQKTKDNKTAYILTAYPNSRRFP